MVQPIQTHMGVLYIISAPSGTGKTTLVRALINTMSDMLGSISHTTRASRETEVNGRDYHFVSEAEFKEIRKKGLFLEYAKIFGYHYGTSSAWVQETLMRGIDVILEIDWQGARQVRSQFIDAISIFIVPPSEAALVNRLKNRHQDDASVIELRMRAAKNEISHYTEYDYLLCNDQFDEALSNLQIIVQSNRLKLKSQQFRLMNIVSKLIN